MAASNNRNREYDTVHHLMSRVAHKVYILNDDDRNDFIEIIRRAAEFVGVQLLGWCLMTNHFHLLVYLPFPIELSEEEILRRYGVLKGVKAKEAKIEEIARLQSTGAAAEVEAWLAAQRKRMYDIASFMKIAKQWFTEEYNSRYAHTGTLWESAYQSKAVKKTKKEMARRLGYIHLNPIRAAMATAYDEYVWSSFHAFKRGDPVAIAGMRFIYDYGGWDCDAVEDAENKVISANANNEGVREYSLAEMEESHIALLDELLEEEKRRRAEEIARRRAAGQSAPCDPLTDEALVIQAAARLEEVRRCGAAIWENRSDLFSQIERDIMALLYVSPSLEPADIIAKLGQSKSSVYRTITSLKEKGVLERLDPLKPWIVHDIGRVKSADEVGKTGLTCFPKGN